MICKIEPVCFLYFKYLAGVAGYLTLYLINLKFVVTLLCVVNHIVKPYKATLEDIYQFITAENR